MERTWLSPQGRDVPHAGIPVRPGPSVNGVFRSDVSSFHNPKMMELWSTAVSY